MKIILTILVVLGLAGCSYEYSQYHRLSQAFTTGCKYNTIQSSLNTEGDTLTIQATCTKDK